MRLPSVPTSPIVDHLNSSYFTRVWNAPDDHGRANFQLLKVAKRVQIGAVPINLSVVGLPTTDKVYAVYRVTSQVFGRFITFPDNRWVNDKDVLAASGVTVRAYAASGRMIPTGGVFMRYDSLRSSVLVAIDKQYASACIGESYPDLYMTVYLDTSRETAVVSEVFTVSTDPKLKSSPEQVTQAIANANRFYPDITVVYVNGWLYDSTKVPKLFSGDVVNIVSDLDIVGYCDVTIDDNQTGYYSDLYKEYREVLHVAKALNPDNLIITTDTLLAGVFDVDTGRGIMSHRIDNHAIESITHNDFSMSRTVLQAYQNTLMSKGIRVRLYVRYSSRPLQLDNDINRLEDLYTFSDKEIRLQLANLSSSQITEWKAAHLEQSAFLKLLYMASGFMAKTAIPQYTQAMGYYDVADTLSQAMHYYTYKGSEVIIQKPARLFDYPCQAIVYVDGLKVPEYALNVREVSGRSISVGFATKTAIKIDAKVAVYVVEGGLRIPKPWNPTSETPSIVMDSEDYALFKIVPYKASRSVWKGSVTKGYQPIPLSPGDYRITNNANGSVTFTISAIHHGEKFYLAPKTGLSTTTYQLDDLLASKEPLIIPLLMSDSTGTLIPQIGELTKEIYINGRRLVEGVDYSYSSIDGDFDDILQTLLEVSNMDYFNTREVGNILEVITHGDKVVSQDKGYVISNLMYRHTPPMIWSKSCGRAFAGGKLVRRVRETGNVLASLDDIADGSVYLLEWSLPYGVDKLMINEEVNSDINLRTRIDTLYKRTPPTYPDTVVITHLHALYSPYLARIISDVASGLYTIADESKDDQFLRQFIPYALLFPRDPTLDANNPLIDRRFVTLAAHYANFTVSDPAQMKLVQRLIALSLTPSQLSMNEVLL